MGKHTANLKKIMSKQTSEKLNTALAKGNLDALKKHMEKLFTFKNIFNMHDDHLIELAEFIADLPQDNDLMDNADTIRKYASNRIQRYHKRREKLVNENEWAKIKKDKTRAEKLDLKYQLWVYEHGFEYSKYQMYVMMRNITQEILKQGGVDFGHVSARH